MEGCAGVWVSEPSRVALALAGPLLQLAVHAAADPPLPGAAAVRAEVRRRPETAALGDRLDPETLNGRDSLEIHVLANEKREQAVVCAVLDNLGKGAAGQAVQNLELMLGLSPAPHLD